MTTVRTKQLARLAHDWGSAPRSEYAYVLGMYLGDGCISRTGRTERLRITLDRRYPRIIEECASAVATLMPGHHVGLVQRRGCVDVSSYSILWPDLLPQHGPGAKHNRRIVLEPWQAKIVRAEPRAFIRGLFHSDGSYFLNPVRAPSGRRYSYDRYLFTNASDDIKTLFRWACGLIGVETRLAGQRNVSVARRASVAILNEFLGPKS